MMGIALLRPRIFDVMVGSIRGTLTVLSSEGFSPPPSGESYLSRDGTAVIVIEPLTCDPPGSLTQNAEGPLGQTLELLEE